MLSVALPRLVLICNFFEETYFCDLCVYLLTCFYEKHLKFHISHLFSLSKVIVEERELTETFNDHYINIVGKSSGQKPCNFASDTYSLEDDVVTNEIVQHYSNQPRILKIRENFDNSQTVEKFQFNSVTTSEIYKLLKNIDDKKAAGTDKISPKLVKISAEVLSQPLSSNGSLESFRLHL